MYRLVAQKPLQFFQDHIDWSKNPDEKFAPRNGKIEQNGTKPLKGPIKLKDEGKKLIWIKNYCEVFECPSS